MKKTILLLLCALAFNNLFSQELLKEILPKYNGLTNEVNLVEEITYSYDDQEKTVEKIQHRTLKYVKGKLVSEHNTYFDYDGKNETVFTYNSKGLLVKKTFTDFVLSVPSTTVYTYEKGVLVSENYESEFIKSFSTYEYDSKGRLIKVTSKDENGQLTNIMEYTDYANNDTYTRKDFFYSLNEKSSTSVTKFENGDIVSYDYENEFGTLSSAKYTYDSNGNVLNVLYGDISTERNKYEYAVDNYIKKYSFEGDEFFHFEKFIFRKIDFVNGKSIGSTEPDMAFIEENNVVSENKEMGLNQLESGCISGNCIDGYGTFNYENGEQYEGFFKNAHRSGPGLLLYEDGSSFNGMWENDEKNGLGFYSSYDGSFFLGHHQANLRNGEGIEQMYDEEGVIFSIANWESGNETSKIGNEKNDVLIGCISGDCQNGFGSYLYENGDIYMGFYKNGLYDNIGMYIYKSGDVFIGAFENQKRYGYGMYVWQNGSIYYGEYANDTYHGLGAYMPADDGQKLIGEFQNGNLSKSMSPD